MYTSLHAWIQVHAVTEQPIDWACSVCDEQGTITGYAGDASDLSQYRPRGQLVTWYIGQAGKIACGKRRQTCLV